MTITVKHADERMLWIIQQAANNCPGAEIEVEGREASHPSDRALDRKFGREIDDMVTNAAVEYAAMGGLPDEAWCWYDDEWTER